MINERIVLSKVFKLMGLPYIKAFQYINKKEQTSTSLERSTPTWKIKLHGPMAVLCSNYSLFNTNREKWIMWNS